MKKLLPDTFRSINNGGRFTTLSIRNSETKNQVVETKKNTPGTRVGPGGRDRMLDVKSRKNVKNIIFYIFQFGTKYDGPQKSAS